MKALIKKFIPTSLLLKYHKLLAGLANFYYGYPSNNLIVIGVTGTNGKSTVCNLISKILEEGGFKTGIISTINYKIGSEEYLNLSKMTMPGRFRLRKYLKMMLTDGCQYAIVETTSEGIKQFRHWGLNYDLAVFTNLTPEHIESHGSFDKYKEAKGELFKALTKYPKKKIAGQVIKKVIVANLDDQNAEYFLNFPADLKYGFTIDHQSGSRSIPALKIIKGENFECQPDGLSFNCQNIKFNLKLQGRFNVSNALAAISIGLSQGVPIETAKKALEKIELIPGRLEKIQAKNFTVFVDYAHEPAGLGQVYQTLRPLTRGKIISVLGSQGGGRDKAKRPIMGQLAGRETDYVIVTNEDPYDDDPEEIINEVAEGSLAAGKILDKNLFKILDRRQAIKKALSLAEAGDTVIITGKGCEQVIVSKNGRRIPWDDRKVVRELLEKTF